jgi:regulator of protease activity HflC (stomatin/prohibitin superfamily)
LPWTYIQFLVTQ